MKKLKGFLSEFEKLELRKNELADIYHNSFDKRSHFHSLEQIVMRQLDIFNVLKKRVSVIGGDSVLKKSGEEIFNIVEHHLHLELGRIHEKDLSGLYDLIEDINENFLKDGIVVDYFLNIAKEKDFDNAIDHLENNRVYTWVRPKLLGLGVSLSVALSYASKIVLDTNLDIALDDE